MNIEPLQTAAQVVASRLNRIRFRAALIDSSLWVWGATLLVVLLGWWWGWDRGRLALSVAAFAGLWLVAAAIWAWWRALRPLQALTLWDERAGWNHMFSSAFEYATAGGPSNDLPPGEVRHVQTALLRLPGALADLPAAIPFPAWRSTWLMPLLALGLALLPRWNHGTADSPILDAAAVAAAAEEAAGLKEDAEVLADLVVERGLGRFAVGAVRQSACAASKRDVYIQHSCKRDSLHATNFSTHWPA